MGLVSVVRGYGLGVGAPAMIAFNCCCSGSGFGSSEHSRPFVEAGLAGPLVDRPGRLGDEVVLRLWMSGYEPLQ